MLDSSAVVIVCGIWVFWYGSIKMCKTKPLFLVKASVFTVASYIVIYFEFSALIITSPYAGRDKVRVGLVGLRLVECRVLVVICDPG